jgi:hypothetical protein
MVGTVLGRGLEDFGAPSREVPLVACREADAIARLVIHKNYLQRTKFLLPPHPPS